MAKTMRNADLYPNPSEDVKHLFLGKDIRELEGPAAIVDRAVVKRNCDAMLKTVKELGLGFRAHVKTHKAIEVTRLQVGDELPDDARLIVSTISEAEQQFPLLSEYQRKGRKVNLLYGIPPAVNAYARLKHIRDALGPDSLSFLIDHPAQLHNFVVDPQQPEPPIPIFVKVDVHTRRAGLEPYSESMRALLDAIAHSQQSQRPPRVKLIGFYSHNSLSYGASSPEESLRHLAEELDQVAEGARQAEKMGIAPSRLTIAIGATPSVLSLQNLVTESDEAVRVRGTLRSLLENFDVELHGGNYPFLDMQQMATHSRPLNAASGPSMTTGDIAFRVLAEVLSVYNEREGPEALVGAGSLALGREPCKNYSGWGILAHSPWPTQGEEVIWNEQDRTGWIMGRISQEHGVLTWSGSPERVRELRVGEKITIFPNHSCISTAGFQCYLVLDSSLEKEEDRTKIIDVWIRCRGW